VRLHVKTYVLVLPDFMIEPHVASGALVPIFTDYPPPDAGLYVVRPPGDLPPRKVRVLTDILLEYSTRASLRKRWRRTRRWWIC
jgi:DNA-binding transcriptional LysR family regulator